MLRRRGDEFENVQRLMREGLTAGVNCRIAGDANITDPKLVRLGDNVRISGGCSIFGHDGSINMINRALGTKLDAVGPVKIGNNVFIGHGTIVLAGATIGDNTIIGAGSVVRGRIEGDGVYIGNPAVRVRSFGDHVEVCRTRHESYPWRHLIEQRQGEFDPAMEPLLALLRQEHFGILAEPASPDLVRPADTAGPAFISLAA